MINSRVALAFYLIYEFLSKSVNFTISLGDLYYFDQIKILDKLNIIQ